jgi:hypothetical protein
MKDDLLERAASVVRKRYDGASEQEVASEIRVLSAFTLQRRRRSRLPLLAIPLVAALLASAAWGTVSDTLRAWVQASTSERPSASTPLATTETARARTPRRVPSAVPGPAAPLPEPAAPWSLPPEPAAPLSAPAAPKSATRLPALATASPAPVVPVPAPSDLEIAALYRAAHRAQFSGGDPGRAVVLWERYLAAAPNGSLTPEARYNRAIALARLGRKAEAAAALEPFARGEYGGYRKAEASSLLEVLAAPSVP